MTKLDRGDKGKTYETNKRKAAYTGAEISIFLNLLGGGMGGLVPAESSSPLSTRSHSFISMRTSVNKSKERTLNFYQNQHEAESSNS